MSSVSDEVGASRRDPLPIGTSKNALHVIAPCSFTSAATFGRSATLPAVTVVLIWTFKPISRAICHAAIVRSKVPSTPRKSSWTWGVEPSNDSEIDVTPRSSSSWMASLFSAAVPDGETAMVNPKRFPRLISLKRSGRSNGSPPVMNVRLRWRCSDRLSWRSLHPRRRPSVHQRTKPTPSGAIDQRIC